MPMSAGKSEGPILQVLDRGLRVLTELSRHYELGVSSLARRLDVNKSTVYRILATLKSQGFVSQDPSSGKYALGIKAFEVGSTVANRFGLLEQASPEMELLAQQWNETVNLAVLDQAEIVYLHKIESSEPLRLGLRVGTRVPAHASALGKAILARRTPEALELWLNAFAPNGSFQTYTPKTIGDRARLVENLSEIRRRGFAVDDEEYKPGIRCVATAILDHLGRSVAAVSVAGPSIRLTLPRVLEEVGPAVSLAAHRISLGMGFGAYASAVPTLREGGENR